jgi:hypothetical protein
VALGDDTDAGYTAATGDDTTGPAATPPPLAAGDTVAAVTPDCCCGGCTCAGSLHEGCATVSALKLTDVGGDTTDWTPDSGSAWTFGAHDTTGFDSALTGDGSAFVSPTYPADIFGRRPRLTLTANLSCDVASGEYRMLVAATLINGPGGPWFNCGGGCGFNSIHFAQVITLTGFDCTSNVDTGVLTLTASDSGCSTCVLQVRIVLDPNTPC